MAQDPNILGTSAQIDAGSAADVLAQRISSISQTPEGEAAPGAALDSETALDASLTENRLASGMTASQQRVQMRTDALSQQLGVQTQGVTDREDLKTQREALRTQAVQSRVEQTTGESGGLLYDSARHLDNSTLAETREEWIASGRYDQLGSDEFKQDVGQRQSRARYEAGYVESPNFVPLSSDSAYDRLRALDADVLDRAREDYAGSRRGDLIGTSGFKDYVAKEQQQARFDAGFAESAEVAPKAHKESLSQILTSMDMAYGVGYGFMATAAAETKAFSPMLSGEAYLPDQVAEQAATSVLPLIGAIGGTLIGAKTGGAPGSMAGQYIGQSVGQGIEDVTDQYFTGHTFAQEKAGEALGVGRGGKEAVDEFVEALKSAATPAAKELADVFTKLGQSGPVSAAGVAGIASFQYDFGTAFAPTVAAEDRFLSASPFRAGMRQKLGTDADSISTADFLGEAGIAAFTNDYSGMMANLGFAQAKAGKDVENPAWRRDKDFEDRYNKNAGFWQDAKDTFTLDGGQQQALIDARERTGNVGGGGAYVPGKESEPQYLSRQDKDAAARINASAKLFQDVYEQHQGNEANFQMFGAAADEDATRLEGRLLRGGGSAAYRQALPGINQDLTHAEDALSRDIAGLRTLEKQSPGQTAEYETLINQYAKRRDSLRNEGYGLTKAAFDTQEDEYGAEYALDETKEQGSLLRGLYGGRSYASLQTDEHVLLSSETARAAQIRRSAANPIVSPADRAKMLAEAGGIENQEVTQRYQFAQGLYTEENLSLDITRSQRAGDLSRAQILGTPQEAYDARIGSLQTDRDQIAQNNSELQRGNLTSAQRLTLQRENVNLQTDLDVTPERSRVNYYDAQGGILAANQSADTVGFSRDLAVYGNAAFAKDHIFEDDQARVDNARRARDTSRPGTAEYARYNEEFSAGTQRQRQDQSSAYLWRQTDQETVHDEQDLGAFHRAMLSPWSAGPQSDPFTRGNAVLGDLRSDLSTQEKYLANTPKTDPAYRQNAELVEQTKNQIAQLEHERLVGMYGALPEALVGAPNSGVMAGIVGPTALTARYAPGPEFGSFGAPQPTPAFGSSPVMPGGATAGGFQTGSGAADIVAAIRAQTIETVRALRGGNAPINPVAVVSTKYDPNRPPRY